MKSVAHADHEPAVVTLEGAERRIMNYGGGMMLVQVRFTAGFGRPSTAIRTSRSGMCLPARST
jgi:hypothetical protein